ncbi:hypothetical protein KO465_02400 [Candidatus Micrarchaeota archaeon]|nr:hypothetical protein [Candidatus Micrarchaeota archaeon]
MATLGHRKKQLAEARLEREQLKTEKKYKDSLLFEIWCNLGYVIKKPSRHYTPEKIEELKKDMEDTDAKRKEWMRRDPEKEYLQKLKEIARNNVDELINQPKEFDVESWMDFLLTPDEIENVKQRKKVDIDDKLDGMYGASEKYDCGLECAAKIYLAITEHNVLENFVGYMKLDISPEEWVKAQNYFINLGPKSVWAHPKDWLTYGENLEEEIDKRIQNPPIEIADISGTCQISKVAAATIYRYLTEKEVEFECNRQSIKQKMSGRWQDILNQPWIFAHTRIWEKIIDKAQKKIIEGPKLDLSYEVKSLIGKKIDADDVEKVINCFMNGKVNDRDDPIHISEIKEKLNISGKKIEEVLVFLNHVGIVRDVYNGKQGWKALVLKKEAVDEEWQPFFNEIESFINITKLN